MNDMLMIGAVAAGSFAALVIAITAMQYFHPFNKWVERNMRPLF